MKRKTLKIMITIKDEFNEDESIIQEMNYQRLGSWLFYFLTEEKQKEIKIKLLQ